MKRRAARWCFNPCLRGAVFVVLATAAAAGTADAQTAEATAEPAATAEATAEAGATESAETATAEAGATESAETATAEVGATESAETATAEAGATESVEAATAEVGATESVEAVTAEVGATESAEAVTAEVGATESAEAVVEGPTEEAGSSSELLLAGGGTAEPDTVVGEASGETAGEAGEADVEIEGETGRLHVAIPGYYQLSMFGLGDMPLGPADPANERPYGQNLGQNFYGWSRLRATPELSISSVKIRGQFDVMTGTIFGDSTSGVDAALEPRMREAPAGEEGSSGELVGIRPFDFRQLYVEWDTGYGILRAGQQASNWGLGLLANDGDRPQTWGYNRYGDLVERVVFATKPLNTVTDTFWKDLVAILGADLVYRDHLADLWNGDLAWQGIFALRYAEEGNSAGMYVAYRNQTFDDGDHLEVVAIDLAGDWTFELAPSWDLQVAAEGIGVFGTTDAARSLTAPEHDILQLGGAVRATADYIDEYFIQLELGAATGDANVYDDRQLRFTFDPDYNVGLIMFEELWAWQYARAATLAGSPDLTGEPVPGLDMLSTNGGVSGALYLNPTFQARPWSWFRGSLGVLWGYATSDVVSPFEQKVNGVPANFMGGSPGGRNLGVELDAAVDFFVPLRLVELQGGLQFGCLFPGDAFADADGNELDPIWLLEGRVAMKF
ncbi:MAG: hypothetical protein JXB32_01935 [Deltaproteobacteria bacterium]|nr:hypothetical protein [Deltaproteobacteria bacterium]